MAYGKLELTPGINTQISRYAAQSTWVESNLIRWLNGQLRKLGGWTQLGTEPVTGTARGMHAWEDLNRNSYLIIGTNSRVQIYTGGILEDVTPIRATDNVTPNFSTTSGSPTVTVVDTANGATTGDWINITTQLSVGGLILSGYYLVTVVDANTYTITAASNATATVSAGGAVALFNTTLGSPTVTVTLDNHGLSVGALYTVAVSTTVGGLTITGTYSVASVVDANNFTITSGSNATSTTSGSENSGNVQLIYLLPTGPVSPTALVGWGGGNWGGGTWGSAAGDQTVFTPLRQWFFDYWGQDVIGNPTNGAMYIWIPPYSTNPNMTVISTAPEYQTAMFTAMPQEIVVSLGAETGGVQDPLLVRWSDAGDYTQWTASATNQAGSYRIPTGSRIVGGIQAPLQGLIWTDIDVWSMQYIQPPFIFGFTRLGQGCGLIAARAAAVLGGAVYWMGVRQFYSYAGAVEPLKCDVWDQIFLNLDTNYTDKIFAAVNTLFNEIAWYYPSTSGNGEVDSYVKYNAAEGLWDYGSLVRTAWVDQSVIGPPVGVDATGYLQQHETSNDANGQPMDSWALSSYADVAQGEQYMFVDQIQVRFKDISNTASLNLTVYYAKNTGSSVLNKGPYTVQADTQYVSTRARGRYIAIKMGSDDLGSFWQLGTLVFRAAPSGSWG